MRRSVIKQYKMQAFYAAESGLNEALSLYWANSASMMAGSRPRYLANLQGTSSLEQVNFHSENIGYKV